MIDVDDEQWKVDREAFWCPFVAGHIGPASRLAVAAQVLLVTGDAEREETRRRIYSINFSWSTLDRTWRWRELPPTATAKTLSAQAEAAGTEPIEASTGDTAYPQTIALRGDMTLNLRGSSRRGRTAAGRERAMVPALPSGFQRGCPGDADAGRRPAVGYTHPVEVPARGPLRAADRFSHLGVYASGGLRMQSYWRRAGHDADGDRPGRGRRSGRGATAITRPPLGAQVELGARPTSARWRNC